MLKLRCCKNCTYLDMNITELKIKGPYTIGGHPTSLMVKVHIITSSKVRLQTFVAYHTPVLLKPFIVHTTSYSSLQVPTNSIDNKIQLRWPNLSNYSFYSWHRSQVYLLRRWIILDCRVLNMVVLLIRRTLIIVLNLSEWKWWRIRLLLKQIKTYFK